MTNKMYGLRLKIDLLIYGVLRVVFSRYFRWYRWELTHSASKRYDSKF